MRPLQRVHINKGLTSTPAGILLHPLQEVMVADWLGNGKKYYVGVYEFVQEDVVSGATYHSLPTSV
jgi:hypothetical protein